MLVDTAVTIVAVTIILGASTANTRGTTVALRRFWLVVTVVALVAVATILGASTSSARGGTTCLKL